MSLPRKACLVGGTLGLRGLFGIADQVQSPPAAPEQSTSRMPPILALALALILLLLVLDISNRTIPTAWDDKNGAVGTAQAYARDGADTAKKPFLGSWRGDSGQTLVFISDGALITVWPASKIQPEESVTKLTWTEAKGILRYNADECRWWVSEDGKTMRLIPLKEDGSEDKAFAFTLHRL